MASDHRGLVTDPVIASADALGSLLAISFPRGRVEHRSSQNQDRDYKNDSHSSASAIIDALTALGAESTGPTPGAREIGGEIMSNSKLDIAFWNYDRGTQGPPRTELRLHWKGGVHTLLAVPRNLPGQHRNTTNRDVLDLVRGLAKVCEDFEIARILDRLGHRTGRGNSWTESRVRSLRDHREIPVCPPREARTLVHARRRCDRARRERQGGEAPAP